VFGQHRHNPGDSVARRGHRPPGSSPFSPAPEHKAPWLLEERLRPLSLREGATALPHTYSSQAPPTLLPALFQ
jgi:hypothetical protein